MALLKHSIFLSLVATFVGAGVALAMTNFDTQIASVIPTPQEDAWLNIGWRTNLMQARLEAQRYNRPLFVWLMNGHPLGCT
ncbi:MAG TPA: hypothetical protein V6D22_08460 [Candidatus Obscuribacterales bacterium]